MMTGIYPKILVPLDGSGLAEQVLPHLQRLVTPAATTLVLVNVVDIVHYATTTARYAPPGFYAHLRSSAEAYLAEQGKALQALGYQVHTHVLESDAASAILQVAATEQVDLIAMTTHGRSGFVRWALGSVAERIVREAPQPVFLVRETTQPLSDNIHRILVPLDGSPLAEQALTPATALAKASGAELLLLQVVQTLDEGNRRILFRNATEAEAAMSGWRTNAEQYLQQLAQPIQAAGVICHSEALLGDVVPTIIATAEDEAFDLVVMGTHGRSGLRRWVYGSVANKVLRGVSCPLLLIHNPPTPTA